PAHVVRTEALHASPFGEVGQAAKRSNTDSAVSRRRTIRPALSTGTNSGPGSGRTVSQAAIASLAPCVAYMIRALLCQGETGLVGGDVRAPPHGHDQRVGGRRTARRHAVQRLHEAARCDRQPAAGAQDRGDLQSNAKTPGKKTAWRTTRNMIIGWSAAPAADI